MLCLKNNQLTQNLILLIEKDYTLLMDILHFLLMFIVK
jgi:hypothetical protein